MLKSKVVGVEIVTKGDLDGFREKVEADLFRLLKGQEEIMARLDRLLNESPPPMPVQSGYLPALEYMRVVGIRRWKFDQLIAENKIKVLKKKRKIYVPVGEVERYFSDPTIQ